MTKVSIILTFHNDEKYIASAIESIKKQTFIDFEVICVNDCSTDNSIDIIKDLIKGDERFKIITNSSNKGLGFSRNIALNSAKGEFISYIDVDDIYDIDFLKKTVCIIENSDVDSVWVNFKIYDETNNKYYIKPFTIYEENIHNGVNLLTPNTLFIFPSFAWNKLYKKDKIIKSCALFFENKLFEDIYFYYIFFSQNPKVYILDDILYTYRKRKTKDSIMDKVVSLDYNLKDIFDVIYEVYKYFESKNQLDLYRSTILFEIIKVINTFRQSSTCYETLIKEANNLLEKLNYKCKI